MGQFFLPPSDVNINLSDVTTSDSTTLKHGFLPKLSGVALQYLNGLGQWVAASGQEFIQGVSVANYAALPAAAANTGLMALVLNNSGIWLINFQSKGIYISDGINWNYEGDYVVTSTADHIANTPSGTITATDIQATVNQLDALKIAVASKDVSNGVPALTLFKINFKNVANTFTSFFTNSNAAARTYTFPDSNGSVLLDASIDAATLDSAPADTAEFLYWSVVASALRKITVAGLKSIFALVGGNPAQNFTANNLTVSSAVSISGGLTLIGGVVGYGSGNGGSVTQLTSKSTSVTLNKPSGLIVMNNAALAAGATVSFQFANSAVLIDDVIIINIVWDAITNPINYSVRAASYDPANGTILVVIKNETSGSLSDVVSLKFSILRGSRI